MSLLVLLCTLLFTLGDGLVVRPMGTSPTVPFPCPSLRHLSPLRKIAHSPLSLRSNSDYDICEPNAQKQERTTFLISFDGVLSVGTYRRSCTRCVHAAVRTWFESETGKNGLGSFSRADEWIVNRLTALFHLPANDVDRTYLCRLMLDEQALDRSASVGQRGNYATKFHPSDTGGALDDIISSIAEERFSKSENRRSTRPLTNGEIEANWSRDFVEMLEMRFPLRVEEKQRKDDADVNTTKLRKKILNRSAVEKVMEVIETLRWEEENNFSASESGSYSISLYTPVTAALRSMIDRDLPQVDLKIILSHPSDEKIARDLLSRAGLLYEDGKKTGKRVRVDVVSPRKLNFKGKNKIREESHYVTDSGDDGSVYTYESKEALIKRIISESRPESDGMVAKTMAANTVTEVYVVDDSLRILQSVSDNILRLRHEAILSGRIQLE